MSFGSSLAQGAASSLVTGAIDGAVGGLWNRIFLGSPEKQLSRQWQYQQQQMDYQARLNRDQYDYEFDKEAAYNDPSAVRARLEKAGLNPALMYGQGAGSPGVSASLGSVGGSSLSAPRGSMNVHGNPLAGSEIEAMSSRSALDSANARLANARAEQQEWETTFLNPFKERVASSEALSAEARSQVDQVQARLSEANFETDIKLKLQQLVSITRENEKILADIEHSKASAEEKREHAALNKSLADQAEAMARKAVADALLSEKRFNVWDKWGIDPSTIHSSGIAGAVVQGVMFSGNLYGKAIDAIVDAVSGLRGKDGKPLNPKARKAVENVLFGFVEQYGEGTFYNK